MMIWKAEKTTIIIENDRENASHPSKRFSLYMYA